MNLLEQIKAVAATKWDIPINTSNSEIGIGTLMTRVVNIISLVVGILAFIYLVYSGILYLTAAGNPDAAKKGQQGIINAIIGIIIVIAAYTIVHVVAKEANTTINETSMIRLLAC